MRFLPQSLLSACACLLLFAPLGGQSLPLRFDFGGGPVAKGHLAVDGNVRYSAGLGYGFEPGAEILERRVASPATADPLQRDHVTSDRPFHFTARVPREGNYRVTVTLGAPTSESDTTIKAELRRLMAERIRTAPGEFRRVEFIVATRTPRITPRAGIASGEVRLKAPRETVQEAWAWDDAITLEFSGPRPAVAGLEIVPVEVPTVFLLGDSTVCDQAREPYNSWGQMLTRFFAPSVAVSNHGESGETYRDSLARRRLDKIASSLRPGDWVLMQFGHNDQKQIASGRGGPFTTYRDELRQHVAMVREHGGRPVVVSPMERRAFDPAGRIVPSLTDYARSARQSAEELGVPYIDLHAMSIEFYEALGPQRSARAFATGPDGRIDNTHHNNFGSYQLAQCVAEAIRRGHPDLARHLAADFAGFSPGRPDNPDTFAVPASGAHTNERPLGD